MCVPYYTQNTIVTYPHTGGESMGQSLAFFSLQIQISEKYLSGPKIYLIWPKTYAIRSKTYSTESKSHSPGSRTHRCRNLVITFGTVCGNVQETNLIES